MCIICVSKKGIAQPTTEQIKTMFSRNSDGAGYMVARGDGVEIHKGFMDVTEFLDAIRREQFTPNDVVVYHFRISTQGGVNREMCHPFGLTQNLADTKALDLFAQIGVAHNGIIPMTTNRNDREYSDTAHFIAEYLPHLVRDIRDIRNKQILTMIEELINSRMALMDGSGYVATVGTWIAEDNGLMFSNGTYKELSYSYNPKTRQYKFGENGHPICIWK